MTYCSTIILFYILIFGKILVTIIPGWHFYGLSMFPICIFIYSCIPFVRRLFKSMSMVVYFSIDEEHTNELFKMCEQGCTFSVDREHPYTIFKCMRVALSMKIKFISKISFWLPYGPYVCSTIFTVKSSFGSVVSLCF